MRFQFEDITTTAEIGFSVAVTDIDISPDGGTLYTGSGVDGGIAAFRIGPDGTLTEIGAIGHRHNNVRPGGSGQIEWFGDDADHAIYLGRNPTNLQMVTQENGTLARADRLWFEDMSVDLAVQVRLDGQNHVFVTETGGTDIIRYRMPGTASLEDPVRLEGLSPGRIDHLQQVVVGGHPALLVLSQEDDSIALFRVGTGGTLTETGRIGAADGLGVADPQVAAAAQVGGRDYILVGSPSSHSISVLSVTGTGGLEAVDHLLDTRDTRFATVSALETVTHEGRTYVVAGGADDGLTLFTLLPGGRLQELATVADDLLTGLTNVQALALHVTGSGPGAVLQIYVADGVTAGMTRMTVALDTQGLTLEADGAGGTLAGGARDDVLAGGRGADRIEAGAGDDILLDGAGDDVLTGGAGADTFIFTADGAADRVTDFEAGVDRLDLSGLGLIRSVDQLAITGTGTGARIEVGAEVIHLDSAGGGTITTAQIAAALLPGGGRSPILPRAADDAGDTAGTDPDCPEGHGPPAPLPASGGPGLRLGGGAADDVLLGGAGDDTLDGGAGADRLVGGDGVDTASYASAGTRVIVDLQNDRIMFGDAVGDTFESIEIFEAGRFNDQLRGDAGDNIFFGGGYSDRLYGRAGDDRLDGGAGVDALYGNRGADILTGGGDPAQRDRFIYFNEAESIACPHGRDIITDFVSGVDRIEISRLDADLTQARNQAFDFIGTAAFGTTAGELRYMHNGGSTFVQADMDGDGRSDFEIELSGVMDLTAGDFLL